TVEAPTVLQRHRFGRSTPRVSQFACFSHIKKCVGDSMNGRVRRRSLSEGSMIKVQLALMTVGTCALVLATTDGAHAAPPAQGAKAPMSIQPTAQRPVDAPAVQPVAPRGEPKLAENSIYAEGLGAGLAYSLNYELMVAESGGVRAG